MSNNSRFYSFRVVSYATIDELQTLISSSFKYAYILHDKDIYTPDDDCTPDKIGTLKSPHYHLLLTFKQNKSFKAVRDMVVSSQNTFVQPMTDKFSDFEYLTHLNAPDKYQYSSADIVCNDLSFFSGATTKCITNDEFLNDICNPCRSYHELAVKYGRDYIKNFKQYSQFAELVTKEDEDIERGYNPDKVKCISLEEWDYIYSQWLYNWYLDHLGEELADKLMNFAQLSF